MVEAEVEAVDGVGEEAEVEVAAGVVGVVGAVAVGALVAVTDETEEMIDEIRAGTAVDEKGTIVEMDMIVETDMIAEGATHMIEEREVARESDAVDGIELEAMTVSKEIKLKREVWNDSLARALQEEISLIENNRADGTAIDVDLFLKIIGDVAETSVHALSRAEIGKHWRVWERLMYLHV